MRGAITMFLGPDKTEVQGETAVLDNHRKHVHRQETDAVAELAMTDTSE